MRKLLGVLLLFVASGASAQGAAVTLSVGQQDSTLGGVTRSTTPIGFGFIVTTGENSSKSRGSFWRFGVDGTKYKGPVPPSSALYNAAFERGYSPEQLDTDVTDWSILAGFGYRFGNSAFGMMADWRRIDRDVVIGEERVNLTVDAIPIGAFARVGLGKLGTVPGRFSIEGRYQYFNGSGGIGSDIHPLFVSDFYAKEGSIDFAGSSEWRLGVGFAVTPRMLLRVDYTDMTLEATREQDPSVIEPVGVLDQRQKGVRVSVGYVLW